MTGLAALPGPHQQQSTYAWQTESRYGTADGIPAGPGSQAQEPHQRKNRTDSDVQKSQSSSSVATALPMT